MTSSLPGYLVTVTAKKFGKFVAAQIARQLQAEITSSLTKCSRITVGRIAGSK